MLPSRVCDAALVAQMAIAMVLLQGGYYTPAADLSGGKGQAFGLS